MPCTCSQPPDQRRELGAIEHAPRARARHVSDSRATIVAEAAGRPLFLQQLTRFARAADFDGRRDTGDEGWALRTILQRRIARLPECGRQMLEIVCIAEISLCRTTFCSPSSSPPTIAASHRCSQSYSTTILRGLKESRRRNESSRITTRFDLRWSTCLHRRRVGSITRNWPRYCRFSLRRNLRCW